MSGCFDEHQEDLDEFASLIAGLPMDEIVFEPAPMIAIPVRNISLKLPPKVFGEVARSRAESGRYQEALDAMEVALVFEASNLYTPNVLGIVSQLTVTMTNLRAVEAVANHVPVGSTELASLAETVTDWEWKRDFDEVMRYTFADELSLADRIEEMFAEMPEDEQEQSDEERAEQEKWKAEYNSALLESWMPLIKVAGEGKVTDEQVRAWLKPIQLQAKVYEEAEDPAGDDKESEPEDPRAMVITNLAKMESFLLVLVRAEAALAVRSCFVELIADPDAEVSTDPITGQPLKVERNGKGLRVYSVGPNGVDDSGTGDDVVAVLR